MIEKLLIPECHVNATQDDITAKSFGNNLLVKLIANMKVGSFPYFNCTYSESHD